MSAISPGTIKHERQPYWHVSVADPLTAWPLFALAGSVAVTTTEPAVGPRQVALPNATPFSLLILTLALSETDQETLTRFDIAATHPGAAKANAENFSEFPGGEA